MEVKQTGIKDLVILKPEVYSDERGYFFESYNRERHSGSALDYDFVQDNESFSSKGVLRGLHYQSGAYKQAKLVRVVTGSVQDVAVDLRVGSETYGQYRSVILSAKNKLQFLIPRGFAHGFLVLEDNTTFCYKCDGYYNKASEGGINALDPNINIEWELDVQEYLLSPKDASLPYFGNHKPI